MAPKGKNDKTKQNKKDSAFSSFVILPLLLDLKMWKRFYAGVKISCIPYGAILIIMLILAGFVAVLQSKGFVQGNTIADKLPTILLICVGSVFLMGLFIASGAKKSSIIIEMTLLLLVPILVVSLIVFFPLIICLYLLQSCNDFSVAIKDFLSSDTLSFDFSSASNLALAGGIFSAIASIYIYISNRKNVFTVVLHRKDACFSKNYFFSFSMVNESKKIRAVKKILFTIDKKIIEIKNYGDKYDFFHPHERVDFKVEKNLFMNRKKYYKIGEHLNPLLMISLEMEDGYYIGRPRLNHLVNSKIFFVKDTDEIIEKKYFFTVADKLPKGKTQYLLPQYLPKASKKT